MKQRLLHTMVASAFMITGGFAMQDNMLISCQVSDPRQVLPLNFNESLCSKLAADLDLDAVSPNSANSQGDNKVFQLSLEAMSKHKAQYSVSVHHQGASQDLLDTYGPFVVETMDTTLEIALPDHLKNDLKRLLNL